MKQLFLNVLDQYLKDHYMDNPPSMRTKEKHDSLVKNIRAFINQECHDLPVDQMRVKTTKDLKRWLQKNLRSCSKSHSARHIELCIAAMSFAHNEEIIPNNPLGSLKAQRDPVKPIIHLEYDELIKWATWNFHNRTMQRAKELYLFQCNTGLSYCDIWTYQELYDPSTGITWLEGFRAKSRRGNHPGKKYHIPISEPGFELAFAIHKKYYGKIPYLHCSVYNEALKHMTEVMDMDKWLTTHTGRKTCATLLSQIGLSVQIIALILANTEQTCRTVYVNTGRKNIEVALKSLSLK